MRKILILAAMAASVPLAACNNSEPESVNRYDAQAKALENAAPVAPPPMIVASQTYRCRDNSLIYVDFYTDNTANLRLSQDGERIPLAAGEGGQPPYTGGGYSVSSNGASITFGRPNGEISCRT
ncbi:MAG: hypothetical protein ACT4N8_16095 [Sphingosinicella sp.]|uniref:hypothetical protein n=1 Tax=Sphingosinicella sp. TaxID=1917971 RepID=UPI0040380457